MRPLIAVLIVTVLLGIGFAVLVATRTLPFLDRSGTPAHGACTARAHARSRCARSPRTRQ